MLRTCHIFLKRLILTALFVCMIPQVKAQSFFSKIYHNSTARYNLYFNSKMLVEDAQLKARESHKDNFSDVLELYPFSDAATLKNNSANMDEVMKKLSTLIEKHGKSKWVDDSYFLMGKSHFFKGDFYAAIDVFGYVNSTYKGKPVTNDADLWTLKAYLMLGNIDDAEALYTRLKNRTDYPEKLKTELNIAGAAVYIKEKKYTSAIKLLEAAIPKVKQKDQKIRYNYVLGQLYQLTGKPAQANERFTKVARLNPPYDFAFNAKISIAKAINPKNKGEIRQAKSLLRNMLKDDKNIDYFDRIYYELGNLELLDKNEPQALEYYKSSLASKTNDPMQKSNTYLAVAELYFKGQDYEHAQLYYDSAARAIDPSHENYKTISERNEILSELIKHLVTIKEQDSLLRLSENEKLRERVIDRLIKEEKDRAADEKMKEDNLRNNPVDPNTGNIAQGNSTFPFYNQAARNRGYADFSKQWGGRPLRDNWRISSISNNAAPVNNDTPVPDPGKDTQDAPEENPLLKSAPEERKKYYENIPVTAEQKEKARYRMHEAYYMAANIYYQSLREPEKAQKLLDELLKKYPKNSFEPNAWYLLSKIYRDKGDLVSAEKYKSLLQSNYPGSNFITILNKLDNPDTTSTTGMTPAEPESNKEVEKNYRAMYQAYKAGNYAEVKRLKAETEKDYAGNTLQSRFDYLEALTYAAEGDLTTYETKLQAIIESYPDTDIARQAQENLFALRKKTGGGSGPGTADGIYEFKKESTLFYILAIPNSSNAEKLKNSVLAYNTRFHSTENLQTTSSFLDDKTQVIIVNNFAEPAKALKYLKSIQTDASLFEGTSINPSEGVHAVIAQENFVKLLQDKKLDTYLQFYNKYYK